MNVTSGGRDDADDLAFAVGSFVRLAWLPVTLAAVGWFVGNALVTEPEAADPEVVLEIGLSDAAAWPMEASFLPRAGGLAQTADVGQTGVTVVRPESPNDPILVRVSGSTADAASEAAATLGDVLLQDSLEFGTSDDASALELARQRRSTAESAISDLNEELREVDSALELLDEAASDEGRQDLETSRIELTRERDGRAREVADATLEIQRLDLELSAAEPFIAILSTTTVPTAGDAIQSLPIALALAAGLLAALTTPIIRERFGRVRSASEVRRVWPTDPIVDLGADGSADRLLAARLRVAASTAATLALHSEADLRGVDEALLDGIAVVQRFDELDEAAVLALPAADVAVFVLARGRQSTTELRRMKRLLVSVDVVPSFLVITDPKIERGAAPTPAAAEQVEAVSVQ